MGWDYKKNNFKNLYFSISKDVYDDLINLYESKGYRLKKRIFFEDVLKKGIETFKKENS